MLKIPLPDLQIDFSIILMEIRKHYLQEALSGAIKVAHRESPSTNRFYRISDIIARAGKDYDDFRNRIVSLASIRV
jgi:hypothetical protein